MGVLAKTTHFLLINVQSECLSMFIEKLSISNESLEKIYLSLKYSLSIFLQNDIRLGYFFRTLIIILFGMSVVYGNYFFVII
jgi:hypothetical protein